MIYTIKQHTESRLAGFFDWSGNNLGFTKLGPSYILSLLIPIIIIFVIMIFKKNIREWFSNKMYLLKFAGWFIIIFTVLNRVLVIASDYPLKWEWFPYHLCRLGVFLYGIFLVIGKYDWIKYIAFWSIIGSIFGLTLVNFSQDIQNGNTHWERNIGPDNYFWWDYFLAHGFGLVAPILLWTIRGWKMSYKQFIYSMSTLLLFSIVAFLIDWIFQDYGVNYFYLGVHPDFQINLGVLTHWPVVLFTYSFLGMILAHCLWFTWILQGSIDFRKLKLVKNKNWEHVKKHGLWH